MLNKDTVNIKDLVWGWCLLEGHLYWRYVGLDLNDQPNPDLWADIQTTQAFNQTKHLIKNSRYVEYGMATKYLNTWLEQA